MTPEAPLAAIDIGSNTIHLVVARPILAASDLTILLDETELVRLGADISASGAIGAARLARALDVVEAQLARARALGAQVVLGVATEGVRAAANAAEVLARIQERTALTPALVTGEQEAALTYWGATSGIPRAGERVAVIDLGGGSMEVVVGAGTRILWRVSLPLGSGVLLARARLSDPPTAAQLARARHLASAPLRALTPPLPVAEVVACGGSATTLALLARGAPDVPDPEDTPRRAVRGASLGTLASAHFAALLHVLQARPAAEIAARYDVQEARARLLAPGALALQVALARLCMERLRVSQRGIREGAILAYARAGDAWLAAATTGAGWDVPGTPARRREGGT